jgi:hypothetical protein
MDSLVLRFSGHQSFALRNTWLTKGVLASAQNPRIFSEPDALVILGVGKNMVESIRYWCQATRMVEDVPGTRGACQPSPWGRRLFCGDAAWDPYVEDVATLWLIHWLLATNRTCAGTTFFAFDELHAAEFTRASLERDVTGFAEVQKARTTPNTIRRDVGVFIRNYLGGPDRADSPVEDVLDCPLVELGLLIQGASGPMYAFQRGPKPGLPDSVFVAAMGEYARQRPEERTLSFDDLAYASCSPGRVFQLDEPALAERLERLAGLTDGAWDYAETAGLRQVLLQEDVDPVTVLDVYYRANGLGGSHGR